MLKTLSTKSAKSRKIRIGVGGDSRARCDGRCKLDEIKIGDNKVDNEVDDKIGKKDQKIFKFKTLSKSKKMIRLEFFTSGAKLVFTKLRQVFVKALILYYFNP